MKPKTLLFLQSVAHGLQLINVAVAGSTHVPVIISVGIAALVASLGYFLQNVGNASIPQGTAFLDVSKAKTLLPVDIQTDLNAKVGSTTYKDMKDAK